MSSLKPNSSVMDSASLRHFANKPKPADRFEGLDLSAAQTSAANLPTFLQTDQRAEEGIDEAYQ